MANYQGQIPGGYTTETPLTDEATRNTIQKGFQDLTRQEGILGKLIPMTGEKFQKTAGFYQHAVRSGYKPGTGARHHAGLFPMAGSTSPEFAAFKTTQRYGTVQFDNKYLETRGAGDIVGGFKEEIKDLFDAKLRQENQAVFGDGSGVVAQVDGAPPAGNLTFTAKYWDGSAGGVAGGNGVTYWLEPGDPVNFINPATGAVNASAMVTAVNTTTGLVTVNAPVLGAVSASDYIVEGDVNGNSYNLGHDTETGPFDGIDAVFNMAGTTNVLGDAAGAYHRLTTAAIPRWKPNVVGTDATLVAYSPETVLRAMTAATTEVDGEFMFDIAIVNPAWYNEQYAFVEGGIVRDSFAMANGLKIDSPFIDYMGHKVRIVAHNYAHPNHISVIGSKSWYILEEMPWQFETKGGGAVQRVEGRDAQYATMKQYIQVGCRSPRDNLVIKGVQVNRTGMRY